MCFGLLFFNLLNSKLLSNITKKKKILEDVVC